MWAELHVFRTANGLLLLWPCLGGVLGLCPPPSSFTQGPLRAGHSSRPVSLGGKGIGPAPTDPEGLAAPGGGAGRFPAHLEVMTPFLLPGGATDVSSQARPRTGGGVQRLGRRRPPRGRGSPKTGGIPHTAGSRSSRQRHREESGAAASTHSHIGRVGPSHRGQSGGRWPEAGNWTC